jgi:FtsP/CotA-like multicopper oxidase with cupredoxin domain
MSGVFIIEGDFDDSLRAYYGGQLKEQVLILQQFASTLNLMNAVGNPPASATFSSTKEPLVFVNGRLQPVLTMQPGETQRWRILNACSQVQIGITGIVGPAANPLTWRQIAGDGVQYAYANYNQPNPLPVLAPANRVDLLVKAPTVEGTYAVRVSHFPFPGSNRVTTLMTINVAGTPVTPKAFPAQDKYPAMPDFLADIDPRDIHIRREITFSSNPGIGRGVTDPSQPNQQAMGPQHKINNKQFTNNEIDQVMLLNTAEEWTLFNTAGRVEHPFHIHVNPFQIVEVYDPSVGASPSALQRFNAPYVWADTVAIPPGVTEVMKDQNGNPVKDKSGNNVTRVIPGYVKIRQRFVDFTGQYVFHCHILAHEDRGMMQLIEVVSNKTTQEHYH